MIRIRLLLLTIVVSLAASGVATALGALAAATDARIDLVAYSTPRDAFAEIIPAFQGTKAGADTSFSQSYGASGEQARAVVAGLNADLVDLSLQPDMGVLVDAGIVARNWNANP